MPMPERAAEAGEPGGSALGALDGRTAKDDFDFHALIPLIQRLLTEYERERARGDRLEAENACLKTGLRTAAAVSDEPEQGTLAGEEVVPGAASERSAELGEEVAPGAVEVAAECPAGSPPALFGDELEPALQGVSSKKHEASSSEEEDAEGTPVKAANSQNSAASQLTLLPLWTQEHRPKARRSNVSTFSIPHSKSFISSNASIDDFAVHHHAALRSGDVLTERSAIQKFMLNPSGWVSVFWDFVSVIFVFYDLITLPLQVFNFGSVFLTAGDTAVAIVWTFDIGVSFLRGVTDAGAVDMRPSHVASKYLRTWFVVDLSVVVTDWILLLSNGMDDMEVLQVLRGRIFLRLLRVLRLVRLMKVADRPSVLRLKELILSDQNKAVSSVLQLLFVVIMINHYVGCGWFAMGQVEGFERNWISEYLSYEDEQNQVLAQYLTSVHWAVTQFTPAAMEVNPVNVAERMYAIVVIFSGLVMFSSFVSSMTSAMNLLNKLTFEQRQKGAALRQYIGDNRVSLELLFCIQNYQRTSKALERRRLHESDVAAFKNLPEDLLQRLHDEVYAPVISMHPLFGHLAQTEAPTLSSMCHLAMSECSLVFGEELFRNGVRGAKMYFTLAGTFTYFSAYDDLIPKFVSSGRWLCEPVLWCNWEHRGRLTLATAKYLQFLQDKKVSSLRGELMALDASEFHIIISRTRMLSSLQAYARVFTTMAVQDCGGAASVDDLWGSFQQVSTCLHRAFGFGAEAEAASKFKMLWDIGENTWKHCYTTWKQAAREERERKKLPPWTKWSLSGYFGSRTGGRQ